MSRWHYAMLNDVARNDAYDGAIRRAVGTLNEKGAEKEEAEVAGAGAGAAVGSVLTHPPLVLDIGSGSGLLAMMAARAGAECVVSCEAGKPLAKAATEIVRGRKSNRCAVVSCGPPPPLCVM